MTDKQTQTIKNLRAEIKSLKYTIRRLKKLTRSVRYLYD